MEKQTRTRHQMVLLLLLIAGVGLVSIFALMRQSPSDRETMIAWLNDNQAVLPEVLSYLQDEQTAMTRETFQQFDQLYRSGVLEEISSVAPRGRLIVRFAGGRTETGERYLHYAPDCDDLSQLGPLSASQMADFAVKEQSRDLCVMTDGTAILRVERVADGWYIVEYSQSAN